MALSESDVELIRASWVPARKDPIGAGVLLFKGLFTKFPDYLSFFSQFSDLDLDEIQENKRLIKHAVKVIDTVTFVVDSVGDSTKADILNEALESLVRSHLKRRIGLKEFRNLGIVLIDFICDLNNRRSTNDLRHNNNNSNRLINTDLRDNGDSSSASSSQDSEIIEDLHVSTTPLDASLLVTAWTKLYGSILDLVKDTT